MKNIFTGVDDPEIIFAPREGKREVRMRIHTYKGWGFSDGHFYIDLWEEDLRLKKKGEEGEFTSNAYEEARGRHESVLDVPRAQSNNLPIMVKAGVELFKKEFDEKTHELVIQCNRCLGDAQLTSDFDIFCPSCKDFLFQD